jgi:hypothetical protein
MPPKIPKKIPPWIKRFTEFAKTKERKHDVQQSLDVFNEVLEKRWDMFLEQCEKEQQDVPTKTRNVDPIKTLGKAFNKVAERIDEAKDNEALIQQYKDRVTKVVPPQIRSVLGSSGVSDVKNQELATLVDDLGKGLAQVENSIQKVSKHPAVKSSSDLQQDTTTASATLAKVSQDLEQLKETIHV